MLPEDIDKISEAINSDVEALLMKDLEKHFSQFWAQSETVAKMMEAVGGLNTEVGQDIVTLCAEAYTAGITNGAGVWISYLKSIAKQAKEDKS